jgi:outer membrane protein assembly factor BamB
MNFTNTILAGLCLAPFAGAQWKEAAALQPSNSHPKDGWSLSTDVHGGRVILGVRNHEHGEEKKSGAAYVFDALSGRELFELRAPTPESKGFFGASVAISDSLIAVGAPGTDGVGPKSGAVFLFNASTGQFRAKLTAPKQKWASEFGASLAIRDNRLIVGAPGHKSQGVLAGAAYLFDLDTLQELHRWLSPIAVEASFGWAVALDGTYAIVGAPDYKLSRGLAVLYDLTTGAEIRRFQPPVPTQSKRLGHAVALHGGLAAISDPDYYNGTSARGRVYIVEVATGVIQAELQPNPVGWYGGFGSSLALGRRSLLVGSPDYPVIGDGQGQITRYNRKTWQPIWTTTAPENDPTHERLGDQVALDGDLAVVTTQGAKGRKKESGVAYVIGPDRGARSCSPAALNSTGSRGRIEALGDSVSDSVVLEAEGMPSGQPAMLLVATTGDLRNLPGADGPLCLGGPAGLGAYRLDLAPVTFYGTAQTDVIQGATGGGLGRLPAPFGGLIQPGDTWSFQYWYRDGAKSNFTDALSVTFVP